MFLLLGAACQAQGSSGFRVLPYLQNPTSSGITIRWLSHSNEPGSLRIKGAGIDLERSSTPNFARTLSYNPAAPEVSDRPHQVPFLHSVRVEELAPDTKYDYVVTQSSSEFRSTFKTNRNPDQSIRFMVYSDSETEPESSTVGPIEWPKGLKSNRPDGIVKYLTDQTTGYRKNLEMISERNPDFVCIAGDLVESGGEQRDWDEFWEHIAGRYGSIASRIPFFPAIGNHENYAGPGGFGGYAAPAANFSVDKYLTYFEVPSNSASNPKHHGRYYRVNYGPITLITIDSSDGEPPNTIADTNFNLIGSNAPDYNPGSEQYRWLEKELKEAQSKSVFTFVQFHHVPYGSGPHSVPLGKENFSGQSGIAMRALVPLFHAYGVDAVFCGHDEMLELSVVPGTEQTATGSNRKRSLYIYDVGIGGDGLRGPAVDFDNPFRVFLAHDDFPEVWDGRRLISGGKHYGHVEVNVTRNQNDQWQATIEMVHAFPLTNAVGQVTGWERRVLPHEVRIEP